MKRLSALAGIAALIVGAGTASLAATGSDEAPPTDDPIFASAHWDDDCDDDQDDNRRASCGTAAIPVPDADVIRAAGIVHVDEVERDDGHLEVEGYDARGREITLYMDSRGSRVLATKIDRDRDD